MENSILSCYFTRFYALEFYFCCEKCCIVNLQSKEKLNMWLESQYLLIFSTSIEMIGIVHNIYSYIEGSAFSGRHTILKNNGVECDGNNHTREILKLRNTDI